MNRTLFSFVLLSSTACLAHAAGDKFRCQADGKVLRQTGAGLLPTRVDLSFQSGETARGTPALKNLKGLILASPEDEMSSLDEPGSRYVGNFSIDTAKQNRKYKPRKHKNFVQFPRIDADDEDEDEDAQGMWGQLLLEKGFEGQESFDAKYIFQAGDHMGGTIDMKCRAI